MKNYYKRLRYGVLVITFIIALLFSFGVRVDASTSYYNGMENLYGTTLKSSLRTLITNTHSYITTYDDCKNVTYIKKTDGDPNNSSKIKLFWSNLSIAATWDGGVSWNREHVWPQSKGWFTESGAGADLHHIRPVDKSVNSSHNNNPYGIVSSSDYVTTSTVNGSVTIGAKCKNGVFEPSDDKKGDTARIIFYLLVRYKESDSYPITNVATSMDMLLEWNNSDPVDASETRRNEAVYSIQGNRNPFIDNSDYADYIWGGEKPGSSSGSGTGSGTTSGTGETLPTTNRLAVFNFGTNDTTKTNEADTVQDGSSITTYTETNNGYTLSLSNLTKVYGGAYDALGNGCLKVGTSSLVGTFSFNVPSNIQEVIICVAGYKNNKASISINGGSTQTISTLSSSGAYTNVIIETSSNKTIVFATTADYYRCKIDAIAFYGIGTSGGNEEENGGSSSSQPTYTVDDALTSFTNSSTKASLFMNYDDNSYSYETQTSYYYGFESKVYSGNEFKTLGDMEWELETDGGYFGYDTSDYNRGHQIGSKSKPATEVIFRTAELQQNVTYVSVYASGASGTDAEIAVYVGTKKIGTTKTLTSENKQYTFSSSTGLNGRVKVRITQSTSTAVYVKRLGFYHSSQVEYEGYTLNTAALRFGTVIDKTLYDTLNAAGATWGVEFYKGVVTDWSTVQGTKVTCKPAQVSATNDTVVDKNGEYYQFALVLKNIQYKDIDTYVSARAYVIVNGVTYYMDTSTYSLRSIANTYLSNGIAGSTHSGILNHIKNY